MLYKHARCKQAATRKRRIAWQAREAAVRDYFSHQLRAITMSRACVEDKINTERPVRAAPSRTIITVARRRLQSDDAARTSGRAGKQDRQL